MTNLRRTIYILSFLSMVATTAVHAVDGTWNSTTSSTWSLASDPPWAGGAQADGSGFTANFNTLDATADIEVTLGGNRTIGNLVFGDLNTASAAGWAITGDTLTLEGASPTVTVNALAAGKSVVLSSILDGVSGLTKAGAGTLTLTAGNVYAGTTILGAGTIALSGGNDRLPIGTTARFTAAATLDIGSTSQTLANLNFGANVTGAITGSGGTLTLTGSSVNLGGLGATTLNATGLSNFTYNNASGTFGLNVSTNDATANVNLGGTVGITASAFNVGNGGPAGNGNAKTNNFSLGQTNTIYANTLTIGLGAANNGTSTLKFFAGLTAPTLTIRGTSGGNSRANIMVGQANAGSDYGGETGTINLTTGVTGSVLDAMVGTLTLGYHLGGAGNFNNTTAGNFIFSLGTLDATTIKLATGGSPNIKSSNGTLTVSGGTVKVQTLRMVEDSGGTAGTATVNINSGSTFFIQDVTTQASGTKVINWNQGTVRNYDASTNLSIASGVTINLLTAGSHVFQADVGRSITASSVLSGTGALTKNGGGTLSLRAVNTFNGNLNVDQGALEIFNTGSTLSTGLIHVSSGATLGGVAPGGRAR